MLRLLRPALTVSFFLWITFVLAAFYVVQKPITIDDGPALSDALAAWAAPISASAPLDAALNIITVVFITLVAMISGVCVLSRDFVTDKNRTADRLEYWLLRTGLGFGAIALVVFSLALAGWVRPFVLALAGISIILIGSRRALRLMLDDISILRDLQLPLPIVLLTIVSALIALLMALTPPTAWDGLVYHLTIPQRVIAQGQLLPQGDIIPHENFPLLMSSLFLAAMDVRSDIATQGIHWVFGVMCIGLVALSAYRLYGRPAATYAIALTLSMPMLLLLSSWAYNDAALAFYIVAAAYAFERWRATGKRSYTTLAACMAGFAMGLKYTSFVLPLGIVAMTVWELPRQCVRPVVRFVAISAMVAAPWYLKNLWFSGNPVYPFIFGGIDWDAMRAAWYAQPGTGVGLDLLTLVTLPIGVALGIRDASYIDGRTGPLLLATLPLLVLMRKRIDRLLLLALLFCAFWVTGVIGTASLWQSRLLLPAFLLMIPAMAGSLVELRRFDHPQLSLQRLMNLVIALVLGVTLFTQTLGMLEVNPFAYLAGAESRENFLLRQMGAHADAMRAVAALPQNAHVQFMWEPRSYLAGRIVRADPLLDALPHLVATTGGLEAAAQRLKADGFTHVLVFEAGASFALNNETDTNSVRTKQALQQFEAQYTRIIYDNKAYHILELK